MIEWKISEHYIDYNDAIKFMEKRVFDIRAHNANELIWLLEHPPLYTAGTSADSNDLLSPDTFPVYKTGRGGQYTYHGPGQRVIYIMLDLQKRQQNIRDFVQNLEKWIIATLHDFNITGKMRCGRVGVWVERAEKPRLLNGEMRDDKIAAIGVRVRKWVSFHGVSLNIDLDLSHYDGIKPCGISEHGVTSFEDLGYIVSMSEVDQSLKYNFNRIFKN